MQKRIIGSFLQFLNEADEVNPGEPVKPEPSEPTTTEEGEGETGEIKAVSFTEIMEILAKLTDITADDLMIGTPADIYGHSTSYKTDLTEVESRLADIDRYYETKLKQEVKFYCWNLTWKDYSSGKELLKKIPSGVVKDYEFIDLTKLIEFFEQNPDDAVYLKELI